MQGNLQTACQTHLSPVLGRMRAAQRRSAVFSVYFFPRIEQSVPDQGLGILCRTKEDYPMRSESYPYPL